MARLLKKLFETPYFRITVVPDAEAVELCGALKVCTVLLATNNNNNNNKNRLTAFVLG